jgi:putative ABC transport system substrate-binding protein
VAATKEHAGALLVIPDNVFGSHRVRLSDLGIKHRLPEIFPTGEYVEAGGLMSYGPRASDLYQRAAVYVDKILKGAKPADLPVEQPKKFELVINLKTANTWVSPSRPTC